MTAEDICLGPREEVLALVDAVAVVVKPVDGYHHCAVVAEGVVEIGDVADNHGAVGGDGVGESHGILGCRGNLMPFAVTPVCGIAVVCGRADHDAVAREDVAMTDRIVGRHAVAEIVIYLACLLVLDGQLTVLHRDDIASVGGDALEIEVFDCLGSRARGCPCGKQGHCACE